MDLQILLHPTPPNPLRHRYVKKAQEANRLHAELLGRRGVPLSRQVGGRVERDIGVALYGRT